MTRRTVPQRIPYFFGCEGESEQAYGQLLQSLARQLGLSIHLEVVNLNPGAGSPIARLTRAEKEMHQRSSRRTAFKGGVVLMDSDQVAGSPDLQRQAEQRAAGLDLSIIWQDTCHEALLLRHMDGYAAHRPPTNAAAVTALRRVWPDYSKPMTSLQLSKRIGIDQVRSAAGVEAELAKFLRLIGLT